MLFSKSLDMYASRPRKWGPKGRTVVNVLLHKWLITIFSKTTEASNSQIPSMVVTGGRNPHTNVPFFVQSLNLAHPKSFPVLFEWLKLVEAFSSYVSAKKMSVGRPGSYKFTLLQALSLTTAPWLCLRRVIRVSRDMLSPKHFYSVAHHFGGWGRNVLQWPPDNHSKAPLVLFHLLTVKPKFKVRPLNTTVIEGHSAMIHCLTTGDPTPTIQWDRNHRVNDFNFHRFKVCEFCCIVLD